MVPSTVIYFHQYGSLMGHPFWQRPEWRNWGCKAACRWAAVGRLKQLHQLTLYMRFVSLEELSHQQSELTSWPIQLVFTRIKHVKETSFKPRAKTESCSLLFLLLWFLFTRLYAMLTSHLSLQTSLFSGWSNTPGLRGVPEKWHIPNSTGQAHLPQIPPSYPLCHLPLLIPPNPSYLIPPHLWMHWYLFVFWWSIIAGRTHKKPKQSRGYRVSPCALMQPKSAQAQKDLDGPVLVLQSIIQRSIM